MHACLLYFKYHLRAFCASFLEQSPLLFAWQNPLRVCACVRVFVCTGTKPQNENGRPRDHILSFSRVKTKPFVNMILFWSQVIDDNAQLLRLHCNLCSEGPSREVQAYRGLPWAQSFHGPCRRRDSRLDRLSSPAQWWQGPTIHLPYDMSGSMRALLSSVQVVCEHRYRSILLIYICSLLPYDMWGSMRALVQVVCEHRYRSTIWYVR